MKRKIVLGTFGALLIVSGALAIGLTRSTGARGAAGAATTPRAIRIEEAVYAHYGTLGRLTHFAPAVVQVKYLEDLGSYRLPLDAPATNNAPAATPVPGSIQAWKAQQPPVSVPAPSGPQVPDEGPLKTDMLVTAVNTIKGTAVKNGDRFVITLDGGTDATSGAFEGDPLPTVGQQEIVFLWPNSRDGSKFATGGPDARFAIGNGGTVKAVVPGEVAQAHDGESVGTFVAAIQRAAPAPIQ